MDTQGGKVVYAGKLGKPLMQGFYHVTPDPAFKVCQQFSKLEGLVSNPSNRNIKQTALPCFLSSGKIPAHSGKLPHHPLTAKHDSHSQ